MKEIYVVVEAINSGFGMLDHAFATKGEAQDHIMKIKKMSLGSFDIVLVPFGTGINGK